MATTAIVIESLFPLALYNDLTALGFGGAVMGFHIGVGLLQQVGASYLSHTCLPCVA